MAKVEKTSIKILMEGREYIPLELSASLNLDGVKLKETPLGTRIYRFDQFPDPPYDIIYYRPDIDITGRFDIELVEIDKWIKADFLIEGLPWLKEPHNKLQVKSIESGIAGVEVTFIPIDPPVRNPERVE